MTFLQNLPGVIFTGALIIAFFVCVVVPSSVIIEVARNLIGG